MPLAPFLALLAFACHIAGYSLYLWEMRHGEARPNVASWTVWLVITTLNLASYGVMTGDFIKTVAIIASELGCLFILAYALKRGVRQRLGVVEWATLSYGVVAILSWVVSRQATLANLIIQAGDFVAFLPTLAALLRHRQGEHPAPWAAWSLGFICSLGVSLARWQGNWAELAYPVVNIGVHLTVLSFSIVYWRQRTSTRRSQPAA